MSARGRVSGFGVVQRPMLYAIDNSLENGLPQSVSAPDAARAAVTGTRAVHLSYGITTTIGRGGWAAPLMRRFSSAISRQGF